MPDPDADQGEHHFRYSLYPHAGGWDENTQREAYALNDPLIVRQAPRNTQHASLCSSFLACDSANIIIETIKRAEDDHGFIVRLYESQRRRGEVTLTTAFDLAGAWRCNLLEENQSEVAAEGQRVVLVVKPYEIITLRLIPANN